MLRVKRKEAKAFTLIELVVVIVIIAILAGLGAIAYSSTIKGANVAACKAAATQIGKLWQADSTLNQQPYNTYGGNYYKPDSVFSPALGDPSDPGGWHALMTDPQSLAEVRFMSDIPDNVSMFQFSPDNGDNRTPLDPSDDYSPRTWLTIQLDHNFICDYYYFGYDEIGTPPQSPESGREGWTIEEYKALGPWAEELFWND